MAYNTELIDQLLSKYSNVPDNKLLTSGLQSEHIKAKNHGTKDNILHETENNVNTYSDIKFNVSEDTVIYSSIDLLQETRIDLTQSDEDSNDVKGQDENEAKPKKRIKKDKIVEKQTIQPLRAIEKSFNNEIVAISARNETANSNDIYTDVKFKFTQEAVTYLSAKQPKQDADYIDLTQSDEKILSAQCEPNLNKVKSQKSTKEENGIRNETKQSIKEREKLFKDAMKMITNNRKPENCLKLINVVLDNNLKMEEFFDTIIQNLSSLNISYDFADQIIPFTVSWVTVTENITTDAFDKPLIVKNSEESEQLMLILKWNEIVSHIHERTLKSHIKSFQEITKKAMFLCIYGLYNYFKYQKKPMKKYEKMYGKSPKISKTDFEYALTELQLFCSCSYRCIETADDLGLLVAQFSKSIAQTPYKMEQQNKLAESDWHIFSENKDCVNVDKDGNGLKRLWKQQLTLFPGANLETAEAIAELYETPTALMNTLENTSTLKGREFLKDVQIRRNRKANNSRRIGIELSKKMHAFFTSTKGNDFL